MEKISGDTGVRRERVRFRGIDSAQLKWLALGLMVLDHIHYFFGFTGKIPLIFSMLGRISAPLFLFCTVEGFLHTHDRKKYFLRIYLIAVGMGLMQYGIIMLGLARSDGFYPQNQFMATLAVLLAVLQGFEWLKQKRWCLGICAAALPLLWPYLATALIMNVPASASVLYLLHFSILPMHASILDGGTVYVLTGIAFYLLKNHPKARAGAFAAIWAVVYIAAIKLMMPELTFVQFFTDAFEWMGIFAAVPMLLYNGQPGRRGKLSKHFFYFFYPAHIYLFYLLSCLLVPLTAH